MPDGKKPMSVKPRLTKREREALIDAVGFILAGEDPWASDAPQDEESNTLKALRSAYSKL